ncbi:MAG: hypothetical protein WD314_12200 [Trueperaceae bacterium]
MRSIVLIAVAILLPGAFALSCESELRENVNLLPADTPPGVLSAELLAAAVHWVEPALPALVWSAEVPLEPGDAGYDAVRYLAERGLLPSGWRADELSAETWGAMLSRFLGWYGLSARQVRADPGREQLVTDLASALGAVGESVRPLALIASSEEDRSQIAFLGVVWNWTVYPRLIIMRPKIDQDLAGGLRPLLDELGNCVVRLEHYVYAPEDTARNLFLTNGDARMYVVGSEPELQAWPLLVPDGQEDDYFSFLAPQVSELVAYAAAFDGSRLGVRSLMALMPRLRTNLPPTRIPGMLRTPFAQ